MKPAFFISLALATAGLWTTQPLQLSASAQTSDAPWYNCVSREFWRPEKQAWCNKLRTLHNIDYQLPNYGTIPPDAGSYENVEQRFEVTLIDQEGLLAFGDIDGDGTEDAAVLLAVGSGESGQFIYLVPVLDVVGEARPLEAVFLGDRIQINQLAINSNQIILALTTQGPNDPQSNPTLEVSRTYELQSDPQSDPQAESQLDETQLVLVQTEGDLVDGPLPDPLPQNQTAPAINTLAFLEPEGYAVRVFEQDRQLKMNLYNQRTQVLELNGAPVSQQSTPGETAYLYRGEFTARVVAHNDGTQSLEINGELLSNVTDESM